MAQKYSKTRFVRPVLYDTLRTVNHALQINRETEDGYIYGGFTGSPEQAIRDYLSENELDIDEVTWVVYTDQDGNATVVTADSVEEWMTKFNGLNVVFPDM